MNATIADLIERLKCLGYSLNLEGESVRFRYAGVGEPPEEAKALLETLKVCKTEVVAYLKGAMPRPYLDSEGDLVIPFGSDPRYHWWLGSHCVRPTLCVGAPNAMGSGQSVEETMKEITGGNERA